MHARRQVRLKALPQVGTRTGWWRALPLSRPSRTGVGRMLPAVPMPTVGGVVLGDELVGDRGDGLDDGLAIDGGRVAAHGGQDRALPIDHPVAIVVPPTSSPAG